ncbi:LLM class flavin-dependent oxidoreductase [Nocardia rosealba]|uniref:LLM class flavin-dependent oxidoreductase n=1 Tax=Nocardia rosealba TaxID=2878563 RepID=UPI001CDA1330|nr:LLM class flavin-dependent oxidoreductase [Nocardia rosealba]MCA2206825.1 LLM class flavin-dependent oxidoreductase [Nocardia rosealba]
MVLRHGVYLPPFGELADPRVLAEIAAEAESAGFDGVFVWDHVARADEPDLAVGDCWIGLAAVAAATTRVVFGPRVTPLSRRRPHDVARESVALDLLSGGRLVLGVGLGSDATGEFSRLGEVGGARERARLLDESLAVITALWSGEPVHHHGPAYEVDGLQFLPRPVQQPRIPIWVAAQSVRQAPLRRAARYDGLCPEASPAQLADMLDIIAEHRGDLTGFDVAVAANENRDAYERAGATWWLRSLPMIVSRAEALSVVRRGP